jgi:hypothetical protein
VWRVAGDSDSEDEESEYESEDAHLPAGQASVSWLRRAVTANEEIARLRVLDRQLVLGDVVGRVEGDAGQVRGHGTRRDAGHQGLDITLVNLKELLPGIRTCMPCACLERLLVLLICRRASDAGTT